MLGGALQTAAVNLNYLYAVSLVSPARFLGWLYGQQATGLIVSSLVSVSVNL